MEYNCESASLEPIKIDFDKKDFCVQVSNDLNTALKQFKNPKIGLRILSEKTGLNIKTLYRLREGVHRPGYITVKKLYRVFYATKDDRELMHKVPNIVKQFLIQQIPNLGEPETVFVPDLEAEILSDKVFCEIYFAIACGPLKKNVIRTRYGQYGLEVLEKMLSLKLIKLISTMTYAQTDLQITFSAIGIKRSGLNLSESFSKPSNSEINGNNHISVYSEGISEDVYLQWLAIDKKAFHEKVALTKKPGALGSIRAFTYQAIDKIDIDEE